MHITVDYMFPGDLGSNKVPLEVEITPNSTIGDLLICLLEKYGETIRQQLINRVDGTPFVTFLVNGEQAGLEQILMPEDIVLIMPPIAGG
jgi:molybdopterin converting factor small subunit